MKPHTLLLKQVPYVKAFTPINSLVGVFIAKIYVGNVEFATESERPNIVEQ